LVKLQGKKWERKEKCLSDFGSWINRKKSQPLVSLSIWSTFFLWLSLRHQIDISLFVLISSPAISPTLQVFFFLFISCSPSSCRCCHIHYTPTRCSAFPIITDIGRRDRHPHPRPESPPERPPPSPRSYAIITASPETTRHTLGHPPRSLYPPFASSPSRSFRFVGIVIVQPPPPHSFLPAPPPPAGSHAHFAFAFFFFHLSLNASFQCIHHIRFLTLFISRIYPHIISRSLSPNWQTGIGSSVSVLL